MKALKITESIRLRYKFICCPESNCELIPTECTPCKYCDGFSKDGEEVGSDLYLGVQTKYILCNHPKFKKKKKVFKGCEWVEYFERYEIKSKCRETKRMYLKKDDINIGPVKYCPECGKDYEGHLVEEKND